MTSFFIPFGYNGDKGDASMKERLSYILLVSGVFLFLIQNSTNPEVIMEYLQSQWSLLIVVAGLLLMKDKPKKQKRV